jgi:PII-like signaling protein
MSQDLPIILEVIDTSERIEQILPRLDDMVDGD